MMTDETTAAYPRFDSARGDSGTDAATGTPPPLPGRMRCLAWDFVLTVTAPLGLALFALWAVMMSLSMFTVVIPLANAVTAAVRGYANLYRRWAARITGAAIARPYRTKQPTPGRSRLFTSFVRTVRDPASWRDWAWLVVNATAGFALALIPIALFASICFYLVYPLLYALTPQDVFGTVYGFIEIHTVAQAFIVTPMAIVAFALWMLLTRPCMAANARITRGMLRPTSLREAR